MQPLLRNLLFVSTIVVAVAVFAGIASAQLIMNEGGFVVTDLGASVGAKKIECSPGGIWGDYVYIADSGGDLIERVDFADVVTLFATLTPGSFPVGLAFGPGPGSNFGDFLYVSNYSANEIVRIDPSGNVFPFTPMASPSST